MVVASSVSALVSSCLAFSQSIDIVVMLWNLCLRFAVNTRNTTNVGIRSLFYRDTVASPYILLFRVDDGCAAAYQAHSVLLLCATGCSSLYGIADAGTGQDPDASVTARAYQCTDSAARQGTASMLGILAYGLDAFNRAVLNCHRL